MVLLESKRDDLLLPYFEMLKAKGINCTFKEFKSYMLKKLTNEARMRNLSLSSNFYLAGAVRYYFNGDLTFNKNLGVFDDNTKDEWNYDICGKLNALINILRNAYIDTVGTTFEQPEDFGELSLPKLLRKYNKKIATELKTNSSDDENAEEVKDSINRDNNIGVGYTFDIIYTYDMFRKYNQYTEPGAWCTTYGESHYNGYIKRLNIHYVVLRKDGWENVARVKGPEWTSEKPQDEYGCSLIALLQSNVNGEPVYITSRWNHGYSGDDSNCEADHAFTKEELFSKTGMNDNDLQRIFTIWNADKNKYKESDEVEATISKEEKLLVLRKLKYAQMRINGGDYRIPEEFKPIKNMLGQNIIDEKINKGIYWCKTNLGNGHIFKFLIDRGKILFETLVPNDLKPGAVSSFNEDDYIDLYQNLVVIYCKKYIMLYDTRRHMLVNVDGITKFKSIPKIGKKMLSDVNPSKFFYELRVGKEQTALINLSTNLPLRLPNGSFWANYVRGNGLTFKYGTVVGYSTIRSLFFGGIDGSIIELIYDRSSEERYFYNVDERRFLSADELPKIDGAKLKMSDITIPGYLVLYVDKSLNRGISDSPRYDSKLAIFKNGKQLTIDGDSEFKEISYLGYGYLSCPVDNNASFYTYRSDSKILNLKTGERLAAPDGKIVPFNSVEQSIYMIEASQNRLLFLGIKKYYYIFDKKEKKYLYNRYGYPSNYLFEIESKGDADGSNVIFKINNNPVNWWDIYQYNAKNSNEEKSKWMENYRRLYVPGASNEIEINSRWSEIALDTEDDVNGLSQTTNNNEFNNDEIHSIVSEVLNKILNKKR